MAGQKFCLRWDGFRSRLPSVFDELRRDEELLDMTLCCDGGFAAKAHRILLSASSPSIRRLLKEHPSQHPVFFLKDTSADDLRAIIEFVYSGQVNVSQTQLASFIKTAEMLQIRGLSGDGDPAPDETPPSPGRRDRPVTARTPPPRPPPSVTTESPPAKRRRRSTEQSADPAAAAATPTAANTSTAPAPATATATAAAAAASSTSAAASTAASASATAPTSDGASAELPRVIKTEQVDLTDDESAAIEDTLACLSSLEDLGAGPSSRGASGDGLDGQTAGGSTSGRAGSLPESAGGSDNNGVKDKSHQVLKHNHKVPRRRPNPSAPFVVREPQLDSCILPANVRARLSRKIRLQKSDWRDIMDSIYQEFKDANVSITGWYNKLALSMATQFPYLYQEVGLHDWIEKVHMRLANKFKNMRRKLKDGNHEFFVPATPGGRTSSSRNQGLSGSQDQDQSKNQNQNQEQPGQNQRPQEQEQGPNGHNERQSRRNWGLAGQSDRIRQNQGRQEGDGDRQVQDGGRHVQNQGHDQDRMRLELVRVDDELGGMMFDFSADLPSDLTLSTPSPSDGERAEVQGASSVDPLDISPASGLVKTGSPTGF